MSFSDQVRLFSQAEIVVAPHGAGLTNILFAENLIVIELLVHMLFQAFFLATGFYGCLASDHNQRNQYSEKFGGIKIDIKKLRDLVAEMLHMCL